MEKVNPKVKAATGAGSASIVVVFVLSQFGVDVPTETAQAITVLLAAIAGYVTKA